MSSTTPAMPSTGRRLKDHFFKSFIHDKNPKAHPQPVAHVACLSLLNALPKWEHICFKRITAPIFCSSSMMQAFNVTWPPLYGIHPNQRSILWMDSGIFPWIPPHPAQATLLNKVHAFTLSLYIWAQGGNTTMGCLLHQMCQCILLIITEQLALRAVKIFAV